MIISVKIWGLILLAFLFFSCDSNKVFEEYIEVENAVWKKENIASFEFDAIDTSSYHNLYINIRNKGSYAFSNLYLFVTITGPDNKFTQDTVNCILADNRGKWKGKGIGDLWDYKKPFLGGVKFAQKGKYIISYEQAMRVENGLEGITDVGLRIEKRKKN
jgi:gliding motility-associated lipoprotein GldH